MVATVTAITSASANVHYFEQDGYYAKNDPEHRKASLWHGSAAAALELGRHVRPQSFESILAGYVPGSEIRLGRARDGEHQHRPGIDITFSAPKSVSLQGLVLGDERIIRAHDEAVRATLDMIERDLLVTRVHNPGTGRRERRRAQGMVAATFRHLASRNLDPQLHTHAVVANMTRGADGSWRSLDSGMLHARKMLIGAHYRNELARRLLEMGQELEATMIGRVPGFEIAGWKKEVLTEFSTRRREIVDYIEEKGWDYNAARARAAALKTRSRRNEPHREVLTGMWRERAGELGIALERRRRRRQPVEGPSHSALEVVARVAEHLEERQSVFAVHDLLAGALAHSPGRHGLEEIHVALDRLRRDGHLIDAVRSRGGPSLVTDRAVRAEREVVSRMKSHVGNTTEIVSRDRVEARLAAGGLTPGQKQAVRLTLLEGDGIVGVQGYAGTGKTTMLREVVELAGIDHVVGLAPSASAARTLSLEAGIATRTLQWFLARHGDASADDGGRFVGKVLVVDEMSLASTEQVRQLMRTAERLGVARLVMVGDSRQLRAVDTGQPFRQLQQAGMATALMDDIRRQRDPGLRAAVLDVIAGEPGGALTRLGADVHEVAHDELGASAARIWLALDRQAREETALMAPTHALRREINEIVRQGLIEEGVLHGRSVELPVLTNLRMTRAQKRDIRNYREGDVVVFHNDLYHYRVKSGDICPILSIDGDRLFLNHPDGKERHLRPDSDVRSRYDLYETGTIRLQAGDRIRWTRNDKADGLVNGATAVIGKIGRTSLTLVTDDHRRLVLALDDPRLRHITHAYATTVHAAQGQTRDKVIAVLDSGHGPLANQQTFYVEISRARDEAIVLTDNREQLAETLEENTGEVLTALEAIGEGLDEAAVHEAVPDKETVVGFPSEPPAVRQRKRQRDRHLSEAARDGRHGTGHPGHVARLAALADMASSADDEVARWAGQELSRETGSSVRHLEERLLTVLAGRDAMTEGATAAGAVVDHPDYDAWRFDLETVLAAGKAFLGIVRETGADILCRGLDLVQGFLDDDDRLFARRSSEAHAANWEARWQDLSRTAAGAGIAVHDHGGAAGAIDAARRILTDPALPEDRRDAIGRLVRDHDARDAARERGAAWLDAWRERPASGDAAAAIAEARRIVLDPALPDILNYEIDQAVRRHESRVESLRPTAGTERQEEGGQPERTPVEADDAGADPVEEPVPEQRFAGDDKQDREARRQRAREAANRARDASRLVHEELGKWQAHLETGTLPDWIDYGQWWSSDPHLDGPERQQLETVLQEARVRLDAHHAHQAWQEACRNHAADAASRNLHRLDHDGQAALVATARKLTADPNLRPSARESASAFLRECVEVRAARDEFLDVRAAWQRVLEEAERQGASPFDLDEARQLMPRIRDAIAGSDVTETERQAMAAVVTDHEARQRRRFGRDRGFSFRM